MLFIFTLIVLGTSMVVFFADEFAGTFKKLIALPGIKFFLPLLMASFLVEWFEEQEWLVLNQIKSLIHYLIQQTSLFLPHPLAAPSMIRIVLLCLSSCLPLCFLSYRFKKNPVLGHTKKQAYFALYLWIFLVVLLVVEYGQRP